MTLAALAGYFLTGAAAGPSTASPHLRAHQRWSGEQALGWLASAGAGPGHAPPLPLDPHQFGEVAASHGP